MNVENVQFVNINDDFKEDIIVAYGSDGNIITSLNYGLNWEQLGNVRNENLNDAIFHNKKFIIVGNSGSILSSDDAEN